MSHSLKTMDADRSRRSVVSVVGLAVAFSPGCLSAVTPGCDEGTVSVSAERTTFEGVDSERINPLVFGDLPESEQEIVLTAIEDDEYLRCFPGPNAFGSLQDRAQEHVDEQGRMGGTDDIYLVRDGQYYRLQIRSLDQTVP